MNRELYRPVTNAIAAFVLIVLVKLVALLTLKETGTIYQVLDFILSLAVIVVLLKFGKDFNQELGIALPGYPETRSAVSGLIFLLVVLTLYGMFSPFSDLLPHEVYNIMFFLLALVPVYFLWKILYKNSDRFSDFLGFIIAGEKTTCSCGWENPGMNNFCGKCGMPLQNRTK
jgi:membrane protease YdiL (CAAX protease family)